MRYVKTSDGVKIAVYDSNPCVRQAVLLVHEWPMPHEIFKYRLFPLMQCGYRVVTMDQYCCIPELIEKPVCCR